MKTPQLSAKLEGTTAVVEIYDDIGPSWAGMIDTKAVAESLANVGEFEAIEVRINSLGGSAHEGIGIFNLFRAYTASTPVSVRIDGIAASSASLVAMAGQTVSMGVGALLMVHEPWCICLGDAAEMRKTADMLDTIIDSGVSIYQSKCGKDGDEIRSWMAEETWFTGDEAVEVGLVDQLEGTADVAANLSDRWSFKNAPKAFSEMIAMSVKKQATFSVSKEGNMTNQTNEHKPEVLATDAVTEPAAAATESGATDGDPRATFTAELNRFCDKFGAENGAK